MRHLTVIAMVVLPKILKTYKPAFFTPRNKHETEKIFQNYLLEQSNREAISFHNFLLLTELREYLQYAQELSLKIVLLSYLFY